MFSIGNQFPFPKTPVTRLPRNDKIRLFSIRELRELNDDLRKNSDRYEMSRIQETKKQIAQIENKCRQMKEVLILFNPESIKQIDEAMKLRQEIDILEAQKFVLEISTCMSMSTNQNANAIHKTAALVSKHMMKSSTCFQVTTDGKIKRARKVSSLANWEPIPEDFFFGVDSDDSDDSVYSDDSVDSVDSEEE
jgi:predicted lactoylglutathione lyase